MSLSEDFRQNAEFAIEMFNKTQNIDLGYDEKSIEILDSFINQSISKYNEVQKKQLLRLLGSFLGECIRINYGGEWGVIDNASAVIFDEKNAVFPFHKVGKQFENGAEDSILSFYQLLPIVFKLNK